MAYNDVSSSGMNYVPLRQVIDDYIITIDNDDYVSSASDVMIRNIALRGIREFGFDITSRVKSIKLDVNTTNNTVALPDDFVDLLKIGTVGSDGLLRVLGQNKNLNQSRRITQVDSDGDGVVDTDTTSKVDSAQGPLHIHDNLILDREDDKTNTNVSSGVSDEYDFYIFENYAYQGGLGRLYGTGGGHMQGEYRINLDQNRIEVDTSNDVAEVVLEYISDEARSTNPVIHVYAEEALRTYIYYKLCERKSTVPANEKARARSEYYNERRKAKARLSNFSKEEALKTIRKNFKLAPKY
tara:strand:- start:1412 stop:2302 length:891 start_codon:yes stop_codon:yes gene_type:complete